MPPALPSLGETVSGGAVSSSKARTSSWKARVAPSKWRPSLSGCSIRERARYALRCCARGEEALIGVPRSERMPAASPASSRTCFAMPTASAMASSSCTVCSAEDPRTALPLAPSLPSPPLPPSLRSASINRATSSSRVSRSRLHGNPRVASSFFSTPALSAAGFTPSILSDSPCATGFMRATRSGFSPVPATPAALHRAFSWATESLPKSSMRPLSAREGSYSQAKFSVESIRGWRPMLEYGDCIRRPGAHHLGDSPRAPARISITWSHRARITP